MWTWDIELRLSDLASSPFASRVVSLARLLLLAWMWGLFQVVSGSRVLLALVLFSLAQLSDFWLSRMASSLPAFFPSFLPRRGSVRDGEADARAQLTF